MRLNSLKPAESAKKKAIRVGRGWSSGLGKTSGKGHKGQKARGKGKVAIGFEGGQMPFHRRIPKSGFTSSKAGLTIELTLSDIERLGVDTVDLLILHALDKVTSQIKHVKIIATGSLERPVTFKGIRVSAGAKAAIEAAGGKVEL